MDNIYYCKINDNNFKILKQIFNLINGIIKAINEKKNILVSDNFKLLFGNNEKNIPISSIIDLDRLNIFLNRKYKIRVFDKTLFNINVKSIKYGIPNREKDITFEFVKQFCNENDVVNVSKEINLNNLFGDPMIGVLKKLTIEYLLTYKTTEEYHSYVLDEYDGCLKENLYLNFNYNSKDNYILNEMNLDNMDKNEINIFNNILEYILFAESFNHASEEFLEKTHLINNKSKKINVIHLILEDELIEKIKPSSISVKQYIKDLEQKYIHLIKENVDKKDHNLIISNTINDNIFNYLKKNNYVIYYMEKHEEDHDEMQLILNVINSKICNHLYIGIFDIEKLKSSELSYILYNNIASNVKKLLINQNKISDKPTII